LGNNLKMEMSILLLISKREL